MLVNSKQNKAVRAVKRFKDGCFGETVIYIDVTRKRIKSIVENACNFLVIH